MYQMIFPALEVIQAMEGLDASAAAGTGAEIDEVRGGLRPHASRCSGSGEAEILGVSEGTFRRWRDRFEADEAEGLYDRLLRRVSARHAPVDEVARVLALFASRCWNFAAKHFHEKLVLKMRG